MIARVAGPVAELRIQVVVVVAFPGWQFAIVGGPDGLKGDGRRAAAACGTELVLLQIPLAFDDRIGEPDGRLVPVAGPPLGVGPLHGVESAIEGAGDSLASQGERIGTFKAGRDRPGALPFDAPAAPGEIDGEMETLGALLRIGLPAVARGLLGRGGGPDRNSV